MSTYQISKINGKIAAFSVFALLGLLSNQVVAARYMKTELVINASPETVWAVLTDLEAYPQWSSFIETIEGGLVEGKRLKVMIVPPNEKGMVFKPELLDVKANALLRWKGDIAGLTFLFSGAHYFKLTPTANNSTIFEQGEVFEGWLLPLLWKKLQKNTPEGFENFNKALKQRAESLV